MMPSLLMCSPLSQGPADSMRLRKSWKAHTVARNDTSTMSDYVQSHSRGFRQAMQHLDWSKAAP